MPTYEYLCKKCSHSFETVQSFSDDPLTRCPQCKGALRKVFGNVGITFKGSGFYKTDSKGSSSTAPTAESTTTSTATSTATKTESSTGESSSSTSAPASDSSSSHSHSHGPGTHKH